MLKISSPLLSKNCSFENDSLQPGKEALSPRSWARREVTVTLWVWLVRVLVVKGRSELRKDKAGHGNSGIVTIGY